MTTNVEFKVWDPATKIMMVPKSIQELHQSTLTGNLTVARMEAWLYLQVSKYEDANKQKIAVGDILQSEFAVGGVPALYIVAFVAGSFRVVHFSRDIFESDFTQEDFDLLLSQDSGDDISPFVGIWLLLSDFYDQDDNVEIVGTIFENPEILILDNVGVEPEERTCRDCGCTENNACIHPEHGPCWWVEDDLCSHCQLHPGESDGPSKEKMK